MTDKVTTTLEILENIDIRDLYNSLLNKSI